MTEEIDPTLPQVVQDFLRSGAKLQEIRLDETGRWTHEGLDFENQRVVSLFSRSVTRTDGGTWVLEIGRFTYPIVVEDTGFFVTRVHWSERPPPLELSDQTKEVLDIDSLEYRAGGRLYCSIKDGLYRARFDRKSYHSIMDFLEEESGEVVLVLGDQRKKLGHIDSVENPSI